MARIAVAQGWDVVVCHPVVEATAGLRAAFVAAGCRHQRWRCGEAASDGWPAYTHQLAEASALLAVSPIDAVLAALPAPDSALGFIAACGAASVGGAAVFQLCAEDVEIPDEARAACRLASARLRFVSVAQEARGRLARCFGVASGSIDVLANTSGFEPPPADDRPDLLHELALPSDCKLVVTVARVTRQKGFPVLAEAVPLVLRHHPGARFVWVGEGEDEAVFRAMVAGAGLAGYVVQTGWRDDVFRFLAAADLFVLPSLWEGTPLVLAEAMSAGAPIVATTAGGIGEMVDADTAILVRPGDAQALAAGILDGLADAEQAAARARLARQRWQVTHRRRSQAVLDLLVAAARDGASPR